MTNRYFILLLGSVSFFCLLNAMDSDDCMSGFIGRARKLRNVISIDRQLENNASINTNIEQDDLAGILEEDFSSFFTQQIFDYELERKKKRQELCARVKNIRRQHSQLEMQLDSCYDYLFAPLKKIVVFLKDKNTLQTMEERLKNCYVTYEKFPGIFRTLAKHPEERTVLRPREYVFIQKISDFSDTGVILSLSCQSSPCGYEFELHTPKSLYDLRLLFSACEGEVDSVYPA